MKLIILAALVCSTSLAMADSNVRNVTVCAAECSSEVLNHLDHDSALVGKIYYAPATEENKTNKAACVSNSKTIEVLSNRRDDALSLKTCIKALRGNYDGETVELMPETSAGDSDLGTHFSIRITK